MSDLPKPIKTWTTPGRGRKGCPDCGTYVAARTKKCPCGHVFSVSTRSRTVKERSKDREGEVKERIQEERGSVDKRPHLVTPSGKCPLPLTGTGLATVEMWMMDLAKLHTDQRLMPSCFRYWARSFFAVGSEDYKKVCEHIEGYARFATGRG